MSVKDVELLLSAVVPREDVAGGYEAFRADLDRSLNLVTDVMEGYPEEDTAQAALHFALLSYAAGVASSRYVALLRRKQEESGEAVPAKKGRKGTEKTKV